MATRYVVLNSSFAPMPFNQIPGFAEKYQYHINGYSIDTEDKAMEFAEYLAKQYRGHTFHVANVADTVEFVPREPTPPYVIRWSKV